jgi:hypothetical protein
MPLDTILSEMNTVPHYLFKTNLNSILCQCSFEGTDIPASRVGGSSFNDRNAPYQAGYHEVFVVFRRNSRNIPR